jgi:hypothetical protein
MKALVEDAPAIEEGSPDAALPLAVLGLGSDPAPRRRPTHRGGAGGARAALRGARRAGSRRPRRRGGEAPRHDGEPEGLPVAGEAFSAVTGIPIHGELCAAESNAVDGSDEEEPEDPEATAPRPGAPRQLSRLPIRGGAALAER